MPQESLFQVFEGEEGHIFVSGEGEVTAEVLSFADDGWPALLKLPKKLQDHLGGEESLALYQGDSVVSRGIEEDIDEELDLNRGEELGATSQVIGENCAPLGSRHALEAKGAGGIIKVDLQG